MLSSMSLRCFPHLNYLHHTSNHHHPPCHTEATTIGWRATSLGSAIERSPIEQIKSCPPNCIFHPPFSSIGAPLPHCMRRNFEEPRLCSHKTISRQYSSPCACCHKLAECPAAGWRLDIVLLNSQPLRREA